jgi:hypothetical protein
MAESIRTPALAANDVRARIRAVLGIDDSTRDPLAPRVVATVARRGYRAEQFEFTSEREIRTPGWLLTPDNVQPLTPTLLVVGEAAAWAAVVEDSFVERLCVNEHCRVAVIDVRGRGDCALAYPQRGRFYFPERILDESYVTWFTLMLGKPILGGQIYDTLRALDYLRSLPGAGDKLSLVGDGPHGVIALYAAALDPRTAGVALRHTVTDYRSLAVAERYNQPFGVYAYGVMREFDLPDVARAVGPRPVLLVDAVTALGEPAGALAQDLYRSASNVSVRNIDAGVDPTPLVAAWAWGRA